MGNKYSALVENLQEFTDSKPLPGVLLANLGTPDAPSSKSLRTYLKTFLSDPRIVEIPRLLWLFILHGIILNLRPKKSAALYKEIWTEEGSPLLVISRRLTKKIASSLQGRAHVELGMRYGNPSISQALQKLRETGVKKIIVLPLYPQYAAATVGSTFDAVTKELQSWRYVPELHFLSGYTNNPLYTDALANCIREHIKSKGEPQKWIFSYHGIPDFCLQKGDPYYHYCLKTTRLCAEKAGISLDNCLTCFQSRFGRAKWLQPYTSQTLKSLPVTGIKNVAILSPAFSADCLETLEELEIENREIFMQAGGKQYHYVAALNDRDDHVNALVSCLEKVDI